MKIMRSFRVIALTSMLWSGLAYAAPASAEAEKLLGQILAVKAEVAEIKAEQSRATADLNAKMRAASDSSSLLSRPPPNEERIQEMQSNLAEAKARVASLDQQLDVAKITDPAVRAAKKQEFDKTQAQLRDEIKTASLPFEEKSKNAHKPAEAISKEWATALATYFKNPETGKFAGATKRAVSWHDNDTGQLDWKDANGNQACWLSIFLDEKTHKLSPGEKTLDGKYGMNIHGVKSIWVFCGNLTLAMSIDKKEWQVDEQTSVELFKALVDVDGLGALKPTP